MREHQVTNRWSSCDWVTTRSDAGHRSEICGEAGAGKTQILLQMLIRVQMPTSEKGLGRKAVYICTEGDVPMTRLATISQATAQREIPPDAFVRRCPPPLPGCTPLLPTECTTFLFFSLSRAP